MWVSLVSKGTVTGTSIGTVPGTSIDTIPGTSIGNVPGTSTGTRGSYFVTYFRDYPFDLKFQPIWGQGIKYSLL